jgi:hypothetical protein
MGGVAWLFGPDGAGYVRADIAHARRDVDFGAMNVTDTLSRDALETHTVVISDARPAAPRLSLDDDGFILRRNPTEMTSFFDLGRIHQVYLREVQRLIVDVSGARDTIVLEHVIRGPHRMAENYPAYGRHMLGWAVKAHIDGDEATYRTWAAHLAGSDLVARCETEPFAVYNVWRPLAPVEHMPLALCHATTVHRDDLIPSFYEGRYPGMPDTEYYPAITYFHLAHNPAHHWYYFPDMHPDEVVIFKQWDTDDSKALCVPHSAFHDPTSRTDARPRQSIEVRVFALR